ncbi:GTPase/DUF3482 domain-containing protein [Wenzhouxiangella sp. XN79A]|uniref:GTPase/DUF3482 domain-containing protein n=1 Tax=Wenzhouxiangella sp. XN79A TaxID=2724193 RepID=UPI00144A7626|nr:GTPase/DUF3482 domain-containing protein [Wenzhouxiangella sp. XN79A]NKI35330.1 GTPase/DUF3482 domain-containing protein [Wenzhouxiangella sp. XN79A]
MATRRTAPLQVAVVGHTNTGKTSLLRTLTRDARFGQVAPTAATTRQVEGAALAAGERVVVELYDTPGLEDAGALFDALEAAGGGRHDGPDRIRALLDDADARRRFDQECRVLEQLLASDCALYVIDAREPVLGKYQDELAILALCARPILPVLNFVAAGDHRAVEWRNALSRVNLHAVAEFDTVAFALEAEAGLWNKLATLLDRRGRDLELLIDDRRERAAWQHAAARRAIAELLVDAAGAEQKVRSDDPAARSAGLDLLKKRIAAREQRCVDELLSLYRFDAASYAALDLPLTDGRWAASPFDPALLADTARQTGTGAGAGAAAGAAFDLATGGLSLGAGTLAGALIGGGVGAAWLPGRSLIDKARGQLRLQADDAAMLHLAGRQRALIAALEQRGHASTAPVEAGLAELDPPRIAALRGLLARARIRPDHSTLNAPDAEEKTGRARRIDRLVEILEGRTGD